MRRRSAGLLVLGAAALAGALPAPAAEGPPDGLELPAGPARTRDFQQRVEGAVARGALWLRGLQNATGGFDLRGSPYQGASYELGLHALAHLTLRSCGVPADDPACAASFRRLREIYAGCKRGRTLQNYQVSLTLLAVEAHYPPAEVPDAGGRYARGNRGRRRIPEADLEWIRELAGWIVKAQTSDGSFGYLSPAQGWEDHSNAQYSLLALKAARRCGVEVPVSVFRRALDHFLAAQEAKGPEVVRRERADGGGRGYGTVTRAAARDEARGWGYQESRRRGDSTTGSMTTAGVSSAVICRSELLGQSSWSEREDARAVKSIRDGIAWLGRNFAVTGNPSGGGGAGAGWHYYYLYGLERAGVLSGVAWMGDRDWYGEGAEYLLGAQLPGGGWTERGPRGGRGPQGGAPGGGGDPMDTCFALLFLKKATFRVEGAVATEQDDETLDLSGAGDLDDATYRAVFQSVFDRYARSTADRRGSLCGDFVRMGARALPLLIVRLEDEGEPARAAAIEALQRVTGQTLGYRSGDPADVRGKAVAAWEAWWFARRGRLVPDAGAGRFREEPALR